MVCENCLIERTDNWKEFREKQRVDILVSACHGLSPSVHRLANVFRTLQYTSRQPMFSAHCCILRDNQVGSRDGRNPFFLFFLILWKFVYRYSFTAGSIVSFPKSYTNLRTI